MHHMRSLIVRKVDLNVNGSDDGRCASETVPRGPVSWLLARVTPMGRSIVTRVALDRLWCRTVGEQAYRADQSKTPDFRFFTTAGTAKEQLSFRH